MGRPMTYGVGVLTKTAEYIDACPDVVPSRAGLAVVLKVSRECIRLWVKEYEEFEQLIEALDALQERDLINGGLKGTFNAAITKLILHRHGYSDKVDNTHGGPNGEPISTVTRTIVDP